MQLSDIQRLSEGFANTPKMPLLFIGHGHPMNALLDNDFTQSLTRIGKNIKKPNAIMVVSAHWETRGTYVSVNPKPRTIYDFGNFNNRLLQLKYEPAGYPEIMNHLVDINPSYLIKADASMGLDHGAWTVLMYLFPKASVPVFQLSIDFTKPASYHFQLAQSLKKLREKGILILGSGNIVHNLGLVDWGHINSQPVEWAVEFDELVKTKLNEQDFESLINYSKLGRLAQLAIPSDEHYLPMLYILGLAEKNERVKYLFEGIQYGSVSMRCFQVS